MSSDSEAKILFDVAGAFHGGAARFLVELDSWLGRNPGLASRVRVVGRGRALTPGWLVARERKVNGAAMRVALNNASFSTGRGGRTVLLRNALHFASKEEMDALGFRPSKDLVAQIPVIRALSTRADRIVVPCAAMADRVLRHMPSLANRIVVRGHPVSSPVWAGRICARENSILVPIVPAPYKNLDDHINRLLAATHGTALRIKVTASQGQLPRVSNPEMVEFLGVLTSQELDAHWRSARAVYYPTSLEAFGYPLAEARVAGRWVIALGTNQSREIAGSALAPFWANDTRTLREAVESVIDGDPRPDTVSNDPDSYFRWLTDEGL